MKSQSLRRSLKKNLNQKNSQRNLRVRVRIKNLSLNHLPSPKRAAIARKRKT
jgi:hypothetical protein